MNKFTPDYMAKQPLGYRGSAVTAHLPIEFREKFYSLCKRKGISPSKLAYQMLVFALERIEI